MKLVSSRRAAIAFCFAIALSTPARPTLASADRLVFGPKDIASAFFVSKSENKNQVHYAVRVDDECVPMGPTPIWGYWRMLESGPAALEPMLPREQKGYGIGSQTVVARAADGGTVRLVLRALPNRVILVAVKKQGPGCVATSTTTVAGAPAHLFNVHVKLKWPFGVSYLLLQGRAVDDARVLQEKIDD